MIEHNARFKIKDKKYWFNASGLALITKMLASSHLTLVDHDTTFAFAPLEFLILAPHDLAYMYKHES
jgi:hypothetical protein